jgi:2,4-dienoyl-CoA reductase-like NADH-dependent reductase (Old Yellow Enzyme family)
MPNLFESLKIRSVEFPNRIFVSPMCQYSCVDGLANDWHLVHLGSRAVGGAGLVMTEATAVVAEGRISAADMGLWNDRQIEALARITWFIHGQGSVAGIQIAHAGRKASTPRPWDGTGTVSGEKGGWIPVGPSPVAFAADHAVPKELSLTEIAETVRAFAQTARRALAAGFRVLEIHSAHGYLLHEFLSPLSNERSDEYGGGFENRTRLLREVAAAVRKVWPEELPLFVRISSTDWVEGGWDIEQSVELAKLLRPLGVDLIDCSSAGMVPHAKIPVGPGYQVGFAERIRRESGILTGAVGMITSPEQADEIIRSGKADAVLLAREYLRDPYWPQHASQRLGAKFSWPVQYLRAAPAGSPVRKALPSAAVPGKIAAPSKVA